MKRNLLGIHGMGPNYSEPDDNAPVFPRFREGILGTGFLWNFLIFGTRTGTLGTFYFGLEPELELLFLGTLRTAVVLFGKKIAKIQNNFQNFGRFAAIFVTNIHVTDAAETSLLNSHFYLINLHTFLYVLHIRVLEVYCVFKQK